jgi:hypothetical protein
MMTSNENPYSDSATGYIIMVLVAQGKIAGFTSKTINGKFGENAGVIQTHDGVIGITAMFTTYDKLFNLFNSYNNGDAPAESETCPLCNYRHQDEVISHHINTSSNNTADEAPF